jgi:Fe-S-cluster containining protein
MIEDIYKQIPISTCPPGCGKCCGILYPSTTEIQNVKSYCERKHIPFIEFHMTVGLDCPYLQLDKSCGIYEVRPFLCRIMGVSVDIDCPLKKCKPSRLLNSPQSRKLYTGIYMHGKEKARRNRHVKILRTILDEANR